MKEGAHGPQSEGDLPQVMIIDERPEMLELMSIYITNMGLRPITAETHEEAISKAEPDLNLLIIEAMLRGGNGIVTARAIRRETGNEKIPVIIMCGAFSTADLAGMCKSLPDSQHISKPFSASQLKAKVREAIPAAFA